MYQPVPLTTLRKAAAAARQRVTPVDDRLIVFSSFWGHFSDNPRAIYEELVRRRADHWTHVWVDDGSRAFRDDVSRVRPATRDYYDLIGRAGVIVANNAMPQLVGKRATTYLQTWHGTPLKKLGHDNPLYRTNRSGLRRARRDYRQWDYLLSQNRYSTEIFRSAFGFTGEVLEYGYPRNDLLSSDEAPQVRARTRAALGLPEDVTVILYAPTFRDGVRDHRGNKAFAAPLDFERMRAALGPSHALLLRLHYSVPEDSASSLPGFSQNVSRYADIRDLYLAADVMVTDYSSTMFDFAVTRKPIILFTYDLEEYRDASRGHYFDITAKAPGPLCRTTDELIDALRALPAVTASHQERYDRFHADFCYLDDGGASARVVDRLLQDLT